MNGLRRCVCVCVCVCGDIQNGKILSHKNEWNFAICNHMNGLSIMLSKINWTEKYKYCMIFVFGIKKIQDLYVESKKYNKLGNVT